MGRVRRLPSVLGLCAGVLVGAWLAVSPSVAQDPPAASGFVLVDQERLYTGSAFGQRVVEELQAESQALADENRRIEDALIAEELSITERRPSLPPEEFRALADDFDARVSAIRAAQDRKARSLSSRDEEERRRFLNAVVPILGDLMQERGATALFDRRAVFLSIESIDITDAAIAAIDQSLGNGSAILLETSPGPILPRVGTESVPDLEASE